MQIPSITACCQIHTRLGPILLAATDAGLAGVWFEGQRHHPDTNGWPRDDAHPVLCDAALQLEQFFDGRRLRFELPLDLRHGTPFQQSVWRALLDIAPGHTSSYGAIGQRIGRPSAVRAVGAAVGRNPISVVVPCHRVVGADGSLTGYAGGLTRKAALLTLESSQAARANSVLPAARRESRTIAA